MLSSKTLRVAAVCAGLSSAQTVSFDRIQLSSLPSGATVVADFNGDGEPDLVVVQTDKVLTLLGNGNGTFQDPVRTDVSPGASSGVPGDFNGDGRLDLALSHSRCCFPFVRGDISILLANGDGTFRELPQLIAEASADYVADINGDGLPDLISGADLLFGPGAVLLNNGDGTFQRRNEPDVFNLWIGVVDVNGDGKPDVIHDDLNSGSMWIALGNDDGTFEYGSTIFSDDQEVSKLVVADFDEDGKPDLVSSLLKTGLTFYKGNGDGTFQPNGSLISTDSASPFVSPQAIDINGDGWLDLVVVRENGTIAVLLGRGNGKFRSSIDVGSGARALLAVADFNDDGRPDLLIHNLVDPSMSLLLNSLPAQLADPPMVSGTGFSTAGFAPGMLATLRGTLLAKSTLAANPALPVNMAGATVHINGIPAPLYYVSPYQINLQIPFGLSPGTASLDIDRGFGHLSIPDLRLVEFAPAIFTLNQSGTGTAVALHADSSLVGDQAPAHPGETISILCTGLGRVRQPVASGVSAPDPPPTTIVTPEVSIGGASAMVTFSGLAAGYVGVYRVDIVVPNDAPKGSEVPLLLSIGGTPANPVTLPVN